MNDDDQRIGRYWVSDTPNWADILIALHTLDPVGFIRLSLLCYLSPPWRQRTATTLVRTETATVGLVTRYTDGRTHTAYALGEANAVTAALQSTANAHWRAQQRALGGVVWLSATSSGLEGCLPLIVVSTQQVMRCLGTNSALFQPATVSTRAAVRLLPDGAPALNSLYNLPRDDSFALFDLIHGIYYGVYHADQHSLLAAAGTPAVALAQGVALVGNVFTEPAWRGLGLATACTSALTAYLLAEQHCSTIVLNVATTNGVAERIYQRLGYGLIGVYHESQVMVL